MMGHEVVAGMRIGVQDAELEHLPPEQTEELDRHPVLQLLVDPGRHDVLQRVALEALHA